MASNDNIKEVGLRFSIENGVTYQKTIKEIKNDMNLATAEFQKATSAMDKNKDALELLIEKQTLYQKQIEGQKQKINILNSELEKLKENEEENAEAISKKKIEITKAETQLNKYQKSLDDVNKKLSNQVLENEKLEKNLKSLETKLTQVEADYQKNISALEENATATEKLSEKQKLLQSQMQLQSSKVEDLKKQLELLTNSEEKNEDAISKKKLELTKAETELNKYQKELKETTEELSKHSKLTDQLVGKLEGIGNKATQIGQGLSVISAGIIGVGTLAVNNSMQLEGAIDKYIATTRTAKEETDKYKQILLDINANNYGEGYEDIANSMAIVKQQMKELVDENNIQEITEDAYYLKDAFGYEINESIRATKMMMDQWEMSAKEAFILITQGAQAGLDKNDDLLDSINEYSVHFKQIGFDAEDMFNTFKAGADSGAFSIDKIGDAIKEMGIRMKDGSAEETLKSMKLNAKELEMAFAEGGNTGYKAFIKIADGILNIKDPLEQNAAGVAIFGTMWEDLRNECSTGYDTGNR